jgi:hypothetical protein
MKKERPIVTKEFCSICNGIADAPLTIHINIKVCKKCQKVLLKKEEENEKVY